MLADVTTIGAPFYAPRYFVELWNGWNTRVVFGGFAPIIRPLADIDRAEKVRDHCDPTWALIEAVADIRVIGARWGWWTDHWAHNLDGWRGYDLDGQPPPHVVQAIERAYPLPKTVAEAHDEYAYWAWRAYMISMVIPDENVTALDVLAAPELDLVCQVRAEIVRRLLVADLVAVSIGDVELRCRMNVFVDGRDRQHEATILRDLSRLTQTTTLSAPTFGWSPMVIHQFVPTPITSPARRVVGEMPLQSPKSSKISGVQNLEVTRMLLLKPRPSDRAIGREVGVSPTTVGSEHKRLIAAGEIDPNAPAIVERRNVRGAYQMKPARDRVRRANRINDVAAPPSIAAHMEAPSALPSIAEGATKPSVTPSSLAASGRGSSSLIRGEQLKLF